MSEQLKFIVGELNKPPYNKNYNLISFDSLEPIQLLQNLNDILAHIDAKQNIDIREEGPDVTAVRMIHILKVLKYKPPSEAPFRAGLVEGDKLIVYPIMEWLLKKVPELQKRAYLGRFLFKIEVPAEIMQEDNIAELYTQYEELIEQFKESHKEAESIKAAGYNTEEIRKDISNMEDEKEQLLKRVERLKRKVEAHPNSQTMMNVARSLRMERDKEKKLAEQRQEQSTLIQHEEQKIRRLQQQLHDTRQASVGATGQSLLQRLEEETRTNKYIVLERLPKDIASRKKALQDLQRVVSEPAMGQSDLENLHAQIQDMTSEVNQLIEKRMRNDDKSDSKFALFKQQAGIIAHKKEGAITTFQNTREELNQVLQEVEQKREMVKESGGGEVLKGEDFKRYVNKLRSKSTIYKKKRQEIAELKAELGVLSRTEEILKQRDQQINNQLEELENKKGVTGYRQTQEDLEKVSSKKQGLDERKGKTLEDISAMVQQLTNKINYKKTSLAPIIKELRPMRQRAQELTAEHDEKKQAYDTVAAGLESNMAKLEHEVKVFKEEITQDEGRYHYLNAMIDLMLKEQKKIADEMKTYTSQDPYARKKTLRETFMRKIQEQENLGKGLREQQKTVRDGQGDSMNQMKMWKDVERLMECKRRCFQHRGGIGGSGAMSYGEAPPAVLEDDRLVL